MMPRRAPGVLSRLSAYETSHRFSLPTLENRIKQPNYVLLLLGAAMSGGVSKAKHRRESEKQPDLAIGNPPNNHFLLIDLDGKRQFGVSHHLPFGLID